MVKLPNYKVTFDSGEKKMLGTGWYSHRCRVDHQSRQALSEAGQQSSLSNTAWEYPTQQGHSIPAS